MNLPNPDQTFAEFAGVAEPPAQESPPPHSEPPPEPKPAEPEAPKAPVSPPPPAPQLPAQRPDPIAVDERGMVLPKTFEDQYRVAKAYAQSGMVPKSYRTAEQVLVGMQFARELGLKPLVGLRQITVINGTPSLWGDLPLALVRSSGQLEFIREYLIDSTGKAIDFEETPGAVWVGAVCRVKRKGNAERKGVYTIEDAKVAGLWGTNVWKPHPKRMCQLRVRNWLLKDEFGDIIGGAPIAEYDFNIDPSQEGLPEPGTAISTDPSAALKERFKPAPVIEAESRLVDPEKES